MLWHPAYVGLGSNLDEPAMQVRRALVALAELPRTRLMRCSGLYGSKPMGPPAQPDFVNAVAGLLTELEAAEFFAELRALEHALGRAARPASAGGRGASTWICCCLHSCGSRGGRNCSCRIPG
jgi:2-amino-4-hydroxy-6-hydroxymethyldihydropteridine diphosphokinase